MTTRDEHEHSKESVLFVDNADGTPLLYRAETPALTAEALLERSRRRGAPVGSPLFDNVRWAAKAAAGRLSVTGRAIHDRATELGLRVWAEARPASRLQAAYRRLQSELPRARPRTGRLMTAGAAIVVLVLLVAVASRPRRTSIESESTRPAALPALPAVALESRLADRSVAQTPQPQNAITIPPPTAGPAKVVTAGKPSDAAPAADPPSGAVDPPAAAAPTKAPSVHTSDLPRRAVSPGLVGTLLVDTEPSGAEVLINGVLHGRTPLKVSALRVGSTVVRLELPGYERWSWSVNIAANKRTPLRIKLQPEQPRRIPGS
jgi:hypothetical protein